MSKFYLRNRKYLLFFFLGGCSVVVNKLAARPSLGKIPLLLSRERKFVFRLKINRNIVISSPTGIDKSLSREAWREEGWVSAIDEEGRCWTTDQTRLELAPISRLGGNQPSIPSSVSLNFNNIRAP